MKNEEKAPLKAQHQKKLKNLKEKVVRLTSLVEQALKSRSGEATSTQPAITTQLIPMLTTPFNPQILEANEVPHESQQATYFQFA